MGRELNMQNARSPFAIYDDDARATAASVDVDPFSREFFADPYPSHEIIREAGSRGFQHLPVRLVKA